MRMTLQEQLDILREENRQLKEALGLRAIPMRPKSVQARIHPKAWRMLCMMAKTQSGALRRETAEKYLCGDAYRPKGLDVWAMNLRRHLGADAIETRYGEGWCLTQTGRDRMEALIAESTSGVRVLPMAEDAENESV